MARNSLAHVARGSEGAMSTTPSTRAPIRAALRELLGLTVEEFSPHQIDTTGELVSGHPATVAGQTRWMSDVASIVEAVPNGRGLGVFNWEATWTAVAGSGRDPADASSGNGRENQALFGYDDKALSTMTWFGHR
ncbi:arabinogalactan endo-1,4-beta-galactosidase [Streptomyces griseochromogenes]|uniref:Arabinogalactan endo-beta-1,4-galactanase n=1 Tax=Streptomyces griseochromogenes TaxID=68214 RepID=A0A1B1B276_9ACTN|nr:hypothetical protein AVL59_28235 [Streptomyces griseochromogenes]MBP2047553.1 arabinogalactan endo-1,4-beta-galactosidase [Streptomyces griseochromogenes]